MIVLDTRSGQDGPHQIFVMVKVIHIKFDDFSRSNIWWLCCTNRLGLQITCISLCDATMPDTLKLQLSSILKVRIPEHFCLG